MFEVTYEQGRPARYSFIDFDGRSTPVKSIPPEAGLFCPECRVQVAAVAARYNDHEHTGYVRQIMWWHVAPCGHSFRACEYELTFQGAPDSDAYTAEFRSTDHEHRAQFRDTEYEHRPGRPEPQPPGDTAAGGEDPGPGTDTGQVRPRRSRWRPVWRHGRLSAHGSRDL